ncbi:MAG TPA: protein kinase [Ktedonobacterales bacterium]
MNEDGAQIQSDGAQPRAIGSIVRSRYRILGVVGRGGLGVVYRVADTLYSSNNVYALKELSDQSPGARKQFALESRWLQELDHTSIPKVRESFEWDDRVYLVMDFVEGENLEQRLRRAGRPLPEEQALRWMLPICDALQYLHTRTPPLLHRDVKPANIIVTPSGHPVLVDFGIAKAHLPGMNQTVTFVRKAGTEGYAPPEQYAATGLTGPWSDVYALGATLYQLLTLHVPMTAVERITGLAPMPRPRAINPAITPLTDAAIMRALELKPANRYQSVTEFAAQMMEALQQGRFANSNPGAASYGGGVGQQPNSWPPLAPQTPARLPDAPASPSGVNRASGLPPLGAPLPNNLPAAQGGMAPGPFAAAQGGMAPAHAAPASATATTSAPRLAPTAPTLSRLANLPAGAGKRAGALLGEAKTRRRGPPLAALISILVVLMVVVGVIMAVSYQNLLPPDRSTPQATVNGYFHALEQQNANLAWQYVSASRNDPSSQSAFAASLSADDAQYGKVLSFTITQQETDSAGHSTATVNVSRANAPNAPITYIVSVTQYDGSNWLIDSASSQ